MSMSAPNAAAVMARRVAQATALDLGARKDNLINQLARLRDAGKITQSLFEVAEKLRLSGNDGAHPADSVTVQEAQQLLSFLDALLLYVYGLPSKLRLATDPPTEGAAATP